MCVWVQSVHRKKFDVIVNDVRHESAKMSLSLFMFSDCVWGHFSCTYTDFGNVAYDLDVMFEVTYYIIFEVTILYFFPRLS